MVMMTLLTLMAMFSGVRQMVPKVKYLLKGPTSNKMEHKKRHVDVVEFSLPHFVGWFVLLQLLHICSYMLN